MKLAIFGGTGRTGRHLVRLALKAGHEVRALARDPRRMDVQHPRLTVVQGDVANPACVEDAIAGTDAVISVLGPADNKPVYKVSQGMQHILNAMDRHSVRRLVMSAGAGVSDPNDAPNLLHRLFGALLKRLARYVHEDMQRAVEIVRGSGVEWTIVRAPRLTDDPGTENVTVAWVGRGMGMRLSREDLAGFMLQQVSDTTYVHQAPAISN
jgi:putative NADH-flavin reductase